MSVNQFINKASRLFLLLAVVPLVVLVVLQVANPVPDSWRAFVDKFLWVWFSSVVVVIITRLTIFKEVTDQWMARLEVHQSVTNMGVNQISFFDRIEWRGLFDNAVGVTVVAITARDFLGGVNFSMLKTLLKDGGKAEFFLADPGDSATMQNLDERFSSSPEPSTRKAAIEGAVGEAKRAKQEARSKADTLVVRFLKRQPWYSCYVFTYKDGQIRALLVPYLTRPERSADRIPVLDLSGSGLIYKRFLEHDLDYLQTSEGSTRVEL